MPLDSNLPTYYFKPSNDKHRPYDSTLLFTQFDSEPEPRYILRQLDPTSPQSKGCYAAALFDAYTPDVVFGEILVKPEWTQPTLSQDEIRKNGGVPPPPVPIIPKEVTVQLYAPDQQIIVDEQPGSWNNASTYHFSMPQQTFRLPSASSLDYSTNDPAAEATTPQINFVWKRDGRKELKCFVTGKSTDKGKKKKGGKEPPIIVAIFEDFKDLTIYEPNLHRVEIEDYKGLEITLLLSATVIRDMWCGQKKDCFNTGAVPRKNSAGGGLLNRKSSMPLLGLNASTANIASSSNSHLLANGLSSKGKTSPQSIPPPSHPPGVPAPDPRQQWEIDAETARLKRLYDEERKAEEARRRERERRDEEEARRIKKMLEQEEKERRKNQAAIDKESLRLMKLYGKQTGLAPPRPPPQPQRQSYPPWGNSSPVSPPYPPRPPHQPPPQSNNPYLQSNGLGRPPAPAASHSSFFHTTAPRPQQQPHMPPRPQQHPHPASMSSTNLMSGAVPSRPPRPVSVAPPELKPKKSSLWSFLSGDPAPRLRTQKSTGF
ncbi:uncharacterized protein PV09_08982 [Verruconis gallopava]|uniref:Uncharacterized protein n=1 Tax=Verruconis gallopava TaxID=253628 RepID=A0A0D1ZXX6_9PEZI|nr:uncharacterized protein PV09_08982 [Verruconis gallopava]KIV99322.1 hypothetical protein PV09_08982 [Verruconis gallopava]